MPVNTNQDKPALTEVSSGPVMPTSTGEQVIVGQTLNGRYLIEKELKRGGMGAVYLARDQQLHSRPLVVKVLLDEAYRSEYVVQHFRQEVEALSRIDHPGIVGIIDAGELPDGKPFIVMQYVEGVTLRSAIAPEGMNLEHVRRLTKQIGRALAAAHEKGILHRDLKPENIMLQDLGRGEEQVKVIDFGIAKIKDSLLAPSTTLNISPGTVIYMAPEQLCNQPLTPATDIYAFGAIAYEMITGRRPFNPETGFELLGMQRAGVSVKPADLKPNLSPDAQAAILKALAFDSDDRYQSARDFGEDLTQALGVAAQTMISAGAGSAALAPTQIAIEETPKPPSSPAIRTIAADFQPVSPSYVDSSTGQPRSRRGLGIGLALAFLIIAAAAAFGIWYVRHSRTQSPGKSPAPIAQRALSYTLTVQRMRAGRPYLDPFEASGHEIFENDWKFRMNITSPQSGYLYLLNEGPSEGGGVSYNMLFPDPATNSGSPYVNADQKIQTGWMVLDQNAGTEKFWMIWAAEAVPELEAVKGVMNKKDKGVISDEGQTRALREFLSKHSASATEQDKSQEGKQTTVKVKGDALVHSIELEHH